MLLSCPDVYQPPPIWLPYLSNSLLFITILSSIYIFYLIIAVTPPHTDQQYKIYLLIYHLLTTFYSALNALLSLTQYVPSFIAVELGLLGGLSPFFFALDLSIQPIVVSIGFIVLIHRFSIILYGDRKKRLFQTMFFVFCSIICILTTFTTLIVPARHDTSLANKQLVRDCPHFRPLTASYNVLYINDPLLLKLFSGAILLFPSIIFFTFGSLLLFCLKKFKEKSQFFSETTRKLQSRLLTNLAWTIAIPCIAHGLPAIAIVIVVFTDLRGGLWIGTMGWILGSTHGIMNCTAFILLNEYYRKKLMNDVRDVFRRASKKLVPKKKGVNSVSVTL